MKQLENLLRVLSMGGLLVLCILGFSYAAEEKVLNIYNWSDYLDPEVLAEFEEQFGVKIYYDSYDSNEALLAKLQLGISGFDLVFPSDYMVEIMIKLDLLEPLDKAQIPNIKYLDARFLNQPFDPENGYSLPYAWGTSGIAYRADYVTEPVDSWNVLFDPKYSGRVVLLDDMRETIGMALKFLGYSLNSTNPEELEQARDVLLKQKPLVKAYISAQPQILLSGDAWLAHNWVSYTNMVAAENPNIRYAVPKEGSSRFIDTCAIPKNAPHKELAHAFLNFILEPQNDARNHNYISCPTANTAAMEYLNDLLRSLISEFSPELEKKVEYIHDLGEATRLWDNIWTEVKIQ